MNRPMTKAELALLASSLAEHDKAAPFIRLRVGKMMLGASVAFAVMLLLADGFGM